MGAKTTKQPKPAETSVIQAPDPEIIREEYFPTVSSAKALIVSNRDEHALGLNLLQSIAVAEKRVKDLFKEPKEKAYQAHKAITEAEKKLLLPLAEARFEVNGKILRFQADERRKAEEEQKRLQEEARKQEEERQLAEAIEAEASGDKVAAQAILEAETTVPAVIVQPNVAKVDGISERTYYRCKVVDLLALVKYVVANPHEIALILPNETALRKRAESMKDGFRLPGCELDKQTGLAVKAL